MKKCLVLALLLVAMTSVLMSLPRNLVVVEIGTGTWCPYCPGAAMGADDLVHNNHPVAIIENHNGDTYANTYSNARNSYYAITGYPTAFFDGLNPSVGGSATQSMYTGYLQKVNQRMQVASRYTIAASGTQTGNAFNIEVEVAKPEADTNTNVVLHVVLTESGIAQNWQGQTHLNFVTRLMVPSQTGTPINLATGETTTIPLTFNWNPAWVMAQGEIVLFLQNVTTKEILQGVKYSLPGLVGAYPVSHNTINFPDTYITGAATVPITITNFTSAAASGTLASDNPIFTVSPNTFNIAGLQSQTINVTFTPTAAQQYSGNLTINSNLNQHNLITIPMSGLGFLNAAPVATEVSVAGPPVVFQQLTADYTFSDTDADAEGYTEFQWMRVINNVPTPIDGAVFSAYTTVEADLGFPIAVRITPRDEHQMPGTAVVSPYTLPIEELPAPRNLQAAFTPPSTVVLNWERPIHFDGRGFVGYRIYRNGLAIQSIANPSTLTFTDMYVPTGTYEYWVCSLFNNPMMISDPSNVVTVNVGVSNDDNLAVIENSINVYPNPFTAQANFDIRTKANEPLTLSIFNLKGQLVVSYEIEADQSGTANLSWDGADKNGNKVQSGIYLYRYQASGKQKQGKILLQN